MANTVRGSAAVVQMWSDPAPTARRLELHLSSDIVVVEGKKRRFTSFYPEGAIIRFPKPRIEVICEVLPGGLGEQDARRGNLPGGNLSTEGLEILRLPGNMRVALRSRRVSADETMTMHGRVQVIDRRELAAEMPMHLRSIGIPNKYVQTVMERIRALLA